MSTKTSENNAASPDTLNEAEQFKNKANEYFKRKVYFIFIFFC